MAWEDRPYYRDEPPPRIRLAFPKPGPATMGIGIACLTMFLMVNVFGVPGVGRALMLTFNDGLAFKQPWRWITYAYLHGGGGHIFWNLLGLYFLLVPLENAWGWKKTLGFFTAGTVAAGITFGLMNVFYPFGGLIGASGGVLAALGACAYLFPEMMFFMIIPIRVAAVLLGVLYLLTIAGDRDASNAAHLGGLIFGFFAPYYGRTAWMNLDRKLTRRRTRKAVEDEQAEQAAIDRILDKVHTQGMNSLSWFEKRTLKRATERQRLAEEAKARRAYR